MTEALSHALAAALLLRRRRPAGRRRRGRSPATVLARIIGAQIRNELTPLALFVDEIRSANLHVEGDVDLLAELDAAIEHLKAIADALGPVQ